MYTTLISCKQLVDLMESGGNMVLLDCRFRLADPTAGRAVYAQGHIPHAQYADLNADLSGPTVSPDGRFLGRNPLPHRQELVTRFGRWGISAGTQIVAYDDSDGVFAARLWWLARWLGHRSVAVLDGQFQAWMREIGTSTDAVISKSITHFLPSDPLVKSVSIDELASTLGQPLLIDARPADRYAGQNEVLDARGGHIPGAVNRPFKLNVDSDGCFKSATSLRSDFVQADVTPDNTVVYCGSGGAACQTILAMEIAGMQGAALYPGSWSEWASDSARPMAQ